MRNCALDAVVFFEGQFEGRGLFCKPENSLFSLWRTSQVGSHRRPSNDARAAALVSHRINKRVMGITAAGKIRFQRSITRRAEYGWRPCRYWPAGLPR